MSDKIKDTNEKERIGMNESLHMLKRLTDATGVPGNEGEVRQLMRL